MAPDWALHKLDVEQLNALHPDSQLGDLGLDDILDHYRDTITTLEEKPITVDHSMGGLIAQIQL